MKKIYIIVLVFITCFCLSCENNQVQNDLIIDGVQYIKGPSNCISMSNENISWTGTSIQLHNESWIKLKASHDGELKANFLFGYVCYDSYWSKERFTVKVNGMEVAFFTHKSCGQLTKDLNVNAIKTGDKIELRYIHEDCSSDECYVTISDLRIQSNNTNGSTGGNNNNSEQDNPSFDF